MKTLNVMIAAPRSGKTTFVDSFIRKDMTVLSADTLRIEINGDKGDMRNEKAIWKEFRERLERSFKNGESITIDNTNISIKSRREYIKRAKQLGYYIVAIRIKTSKETIIARAKEDGFPRVVLYTMLKRLEEPTLEEGFDEIIEVKGE